MQKSSKRLEKTTQELEQFFAGRLARAIEFKYGSIHLELDGTLSREDVDALHRILSANSITDRSWRVQQVNNLIVLSVPIDDLERD